MKTWLGILAILLVTFQANAQELQASVNISTPQLTTVNPKVFNSMQQDIEELLKNTSWTSVQYQNHEQIRVDFQINIVADDVFKESSNSFQANVQIQVTRPVYGSSYTTVLFTFIDRGVKFYYEPFQPLQRSTSNYVNGLSSLFSFYAYMIIGMDYDSFVKYGGSDYYSTAQEIVNTIPTQTAEVMSGWSVTEKSNKGKTRYWLLENLTNSRMTNFRDGFYIYHRKGLDLMAENPLEGRSNIIDALRKIQISNESYYNSLLVQLFCNAKRDEIIEIFKAASESEKQDVYNIMRQMDNTNANKYKVLNS
jgi:hypothetical protein